MSAKSFCDEDFTSLCLKHACPSSFCIESAYPLLILYLAALDQLLYKLEEKSNGTIYEIGWLGAERLLASNVYPVPEVEALAVWDEMMESKRLPGLNCAVTLST